MNEIVIKGQKVAFKQTDTESPEGFNAAIEFAAARIREAETRSPNSASHQIALLALVDLASKYLEAKARTAEYQRRIQDKIQEKSETLSDLLSDA
jgi:cell division protein ZapA (FtsZ GTPase activity inhibitor)